MRGGVLINIDVPDLDRGVAFYTSAFGLSLSRRIGDGVAELTGWPATVYLLEKPAGSLALPDGGAPWDYARHWTPVHLDVVVDEIAAARDRALAAGAVLERDVASAEWGDLALLADPFGNGFCLIAFRGRGYGEIA